MNQPPPMVGMAQRKGRWLCGHSYWPSPHLVSSGAPDSGPVALWLCGSVPLCPCAPVPLCLCASVPLCVSMEQRPVGTPDSGPVEECLCGSVALCHCASVPLWSRVGCCLSGSQEVTCTKLWSFAYLSGPVLFCLKVA